jgi:hypothetical protein
MINEYLKGRACIEIVRGSLIREEFFSLSFSCSLCFGFQLFLTLLYHFAWFTAFHAFVGVAAFPTSR